mmetsp:Transcript_144014/g.203764  ORF Transcript_144014/g.203764 Transcript_144014/m.203764 type:complete len:135 (+) Transcript_144014:40-444(+)
MDTIINCVASIVGTNDVSGKVIFTQRVCGSSSQPASIEGRILGLKKGEYSIAVHEFGDISDYGAKTGDQFSPKGQSVGLMCHLDVKDPAEQLILNDKTSVTLIGPESVIGRSVVVRDKAGLIIGCGVIGIGNMH